MPTTEATCPHCNGPIPPDATHLPFCSENCCHADSRKGRTRGCDPDCCMGGGHSGPCKPELSEREAERDYDRDW